MSKTEQRQGSIDIATPVSGVWRPEERWPRMMQWLDSWFPSDVAWPGQAHLLRVEELRSDGRLTLRIEFPGVDPEKDIDVTVDNGQLTVSGRREESKEGPLRSEFHYGEFVRSVPLPRGVDSESIQATYDKGILEISMAVPDGQSAEKHIPVAKRG